MSNSRKLNKGRRKAAGFSPALQSELQELLNSAQMHHRLNQLVQAEKLYREILLRYPQHAVALHQLGLIAYQAGQLQAAADLFQKAINLRPNFVDAYCNLGSVQLSQKAFRAAVDSYRCAIALQPQAPPEVYYFLGAALQAQGELSAAAESYQKAIVLKPDFAEAYSRLGMIWELQKNWSAAHRCYKQVVTLQPENLSSNMILGSALFRLGLLPDAVVLCRQIIQKWPDWAAAHNLLGSVLQVSGDLNEAAICFQKAIILKLDRVDAEYNLCNNLVERGEFAIARESFQALMARWPHLPDAHMGFGQLLLLLGEFREGWAEWEYPWTQPANFLLEKRTFAQPEWDGSCLQNKTLFLYLPFNDLGIGDIVQFVRYAVLLKAQGARVILECPSALKCLLGTCHALDVLVSSEETLPAFDMHVSLTALPLMFKTELSSVPAPVPYLHAPAVSPLAEDLQRHLLNAKGMKVGLVWSPKVALPPEYNDHKRYCPLKYFEPLLEQNFASFFSLYRGSRIDELWPYRDKVTDVGSWCNDFSDTAWVISQLDLLISVDTSVAHVAAAMGKQTWVLLPNIPDWRWLLDRRDSPWYPDVRLFRQPTRGDWQSVIHEVTIDLQQLQVRFSGQTA
jgi:tetratricopeptide (TPR) repeat protein